jgi:hypothetical protein
MRGETLHSRLILTHLGPASGPSPVVGEPSPGPRRGAAIRGRPCPGRPCPRLLLLSASAGTRTRPASPLREEVARPQQTAKGKGVPVAIAENSTNPSLTCGDVVLFGLGQRVLRRAARGRPPGRYPRQPAGRRIRPGRPPAAPRWRAPAARLMPVPLPPGERRPGGRAAVCRRRPSHGHTGPGCVQPPPWRTPRSGGGRPHGARSGSP